MTGHQPVHHPPQRVGVVAESLPGETRVAATPSTARLLLGLGYEVVVESGAGAASGFGDEAYAEAGAGIGEAWAADVVLKVNAPTDGRRRARRRRRRGRCRRRRRRSPRRG
ncbi:hypothetical protein AB0J75_37025, partial [Streptomyces sp. NPDC049744]